MKQKKRKKPNECLNCRKEFLSYYSSKGMYCSNKCQNSFQRKTYISNWKKGKQEGIISDGTLSSYVRKYIFEKYDSRCAKCGWNEKNIYSGKIPLEIDHIDGDHKNNKEENLILLCPNCHSLTPTYKALNKGKGRPRNHKRKTIK